MTVATQLKSMDFVMFARASEGLTHFRGIAVSFLAMLLGGAFLFLGVYFAGRSTGGFGRIMLFLCWLIYAGIAGTGVSATGIMLLDRARETPPRSLSDALVFGFICFLKACVIGIAIGAAALLFGLLAAIAYFICKIPGVGPLLLFFTHPVLVILAGLFAFFSGIFAALSAPALWDGDTVTQAIAKSIAILKERAVTTVLYLLVMGFVTAIILGIIGAVIVPGYFSMTGLAAGIVGANVGADISMLTNLPMALMYLSSGASGHVLSMMLATAVLVMLVVAAALQVQLMGINLVYLGVSEGVDMVAAESMLKHQFDQAKAKAEEARQRAIVAAERAKAAAQQARSTSPAAAPAQAGALLCPGCNAAISPTDAFCENCGHKLK
jgi:hypothetical protein